MPTSYATLLQQLCREHMTHKISFADYRRRRKTLLSKIDEQFNGVPQPCVSNLTAPGIPQEEFGINQFHSNSNE